MPGISYQVYGTTSLWRVILEYNGLVDPLNDVYAGMVLNLPDKATITSALTQQQVSTGTNSFTI